MLPDCVMLMLVFSRKFTSFLEHFGKYVYLLLFAKLNKEIYTGVISANDSARTNSRVRN